jgi:Nif-specific regulatory protein
MNDLAVRAMEAIRQIGVRIAGADDPREILRATLAILAETIGYEAGMITLIDGDDGDLLVEAVYGVAEERSREVRYHAGEGITGVMLKSGGPLAIPRLGADPRFVNRLGVYPPESAFVGAPITAGGAIQGALSVSAPASERYRLDDHLSVIATVANLIGAVVPRRIETNRRLEGLERETRALKGELKGKYRPDNMVGASKAMSQVFETLVQVSKWNTTVLIRGETGVGKELVAKAIHYQSARASGPFVKLNCAALPDTLLESELFGYEKGAFTGAHIAKPGRFELAHGGTLFLDEIGDTSATFQTKLLRAIQEGQFERLGGVRTVTVDVRIIAATNVDLEQAVSERRFREDLYYRLNVMPIFLPPLRERREDIPYLVDFFLSKLSAQRGEKVSIDGEALALLSACDFPGNVRELENCVERAAVRADDGVIHAGCVPCAVTGCLSKTIRHAPSSSPFAGPAVGPAAADSAVDLARIANERDRVIAALDRSGWVQAKAARLLDMSPRQIGYRIRKLNIPLKHY